MLLLENISHDELKKYMKEFYNYALEHLAIDRAPRIIFKKNKNNADDMFGKTGYYDPETETIALFVTDRHAKDVLRSFAHELIHHQQKCEGLDTDLDLSKTASDPAYASHDEKLREMERQAFDEGNMLFRDWCDMKKLERGKNVMNEATKKEKMPDPAHDGSKVTGGDFAVTAKKIAISKNTGDKTQLKKQQNIMKKLKGKETKKESATYNGNVEYVEALEEVKKMKCEACGGMYSEGTEHTCKGMAKESKQMPYSQLFDKKERLFQDRMNTHEELIYQELLKRAIK